MLTPENLQEFINKFQTNEKNVAREYVQHLFLAGLYKLSGAEKLLFKGGTALRLVFLSPRFSEDLDFTGQGRYSHKQIDTLFLDALSNLEKIGIDVSYKEAKPTSGGYLGLIQYKLFGLSDEIKFEVSLRSGRRLQAELFTIASELTLPYTVVCVAPRELVLGKMEALLARKKPRDYYDLYFMLRQPQLNKFIDKNKLKAIARDLGSEDINFKRELSVLLPVSHHLILRNFKKVLSNEIGRYF